MPEGHTLFRLARTIDDHFGGRVVRVTSPQGRFAESAGLLDGTRLATARSPTASTCSWTSSTTGCVHVHLGLYGKFLVSDGEARRAVGQVRLRLVAGSGDGRPPAYGDLRGATACELMTGEQQQRARRPARARPAARRRGLDPGLGAGRPQPGPDRRPADGPVGAGRRRQRLPRRGAVPAPGATRCGRGARCAAGTFEQMWNDLVVLMADGVRLGRIDTVQRRPDPGATWAGCRARTTHGSPVYVYRRARRALLRLRQPGPDPGAGGPQPVLVPALPAEVPVPGPGGLTARSARLPNRRRERRSLDH